MSEQEKFLDRWSRRKQNAEKTDVVNPDTENVAAVPEQPGTVGGKVAAGEAANAAPAVDLSMLPSLDSISEATDIRAFLSAGVPAQLTRAALRNAWSADPVIRDFIGLSENSWDFNAPDSIPGFGTISSPAELRRMTEQVFGDMTKAADEIAGPPEAEAPARAEPDSENQDREPESVSGEEIAGERETAPAEAVAEDSPEDTAGDTGIADIAPHNSEMQRHPPVPRRKHGSALPS